MNLDLYYMKYLWKGFHFVQGQTVLPEFNIAKEANGTGKRIIKSFNVDVDGTLEISFYWAGKGTNSIPYRNSYGPLISAISVTPSKWTKFALMFSLLHSSLFSHWWWCSNIFFHVDFKPDTGKNISAGAIVGIVAGACAVIMLFSVAIWLCLRKKNAEDSGKKIN